MSKQLTKTAEKNRSKMGDFLPSPLYDYYAQFAYRESELLKQLRQETAQLKRGAMQVLPEQGQLLHLLVKLLRAKTVLEVGTFTGYSSVCIATALPDKGQLVTCDNNDEWKVIAQKFWQLAAIDHKISLNLAPAVETLDQLIADKQSFDFAFIDANKSDYDRYYEQCLLLLKVGGCMVFDNMLSAGRFLASDQENQSNMAQAVRQLNAKIQQDQRVDMCMVPIGSGMTLIRKR